MVAVQWTAAFDTSTTLSAGEAFFVFCTSFVLLLQLSVGFLSRVLGAFQSLAGERPVPAGASEACWGRR